MKTCLFTGTWLDGYDNIGDSYNARYQKYLWYYQGIKAQIGWDEIYLVENGSRLSSIEPYLAPDFRYYRYEETLLRSTVFGYPYCWRTLWHARTLLEQYDKIIMIDSDAFVLTRRLADYIRHRDTGYTAFWCPTFGFPENSVQILCRDAFSHFLEFTSRDYMHFLGMCMEKSVPFTHIERGFTCDRWGEKVRDQQPWMDLYSQCRVKTEMVFEGFNRGILHSLQ